MIGYYLIQTLSLWWVLCGQSKYVMNLRKYRSRLFWCLSFCIHNRDISSSETCKLFAKPLLRAFECILGLLCWGCKSCFLLRLTWTTIRWLHLARTFQKSWRLRIRPLDIYGPRIFRLLPLMKTWTRCLEIFLDLWNLDFVAASIMALKIWMVVARRAIYVAFGCWTTTDVELLRCVLDVRYRGVLNQHFLL